MSNDKRKENIDQVNALPDDGEWSLAEIANLLDLKKNHIKGHFDTFRDLLHCCNSPTGNQQRKYKKDIIKAYLVFRDMKHVHEWGSVKADALLRRLEFSKVWENYVAGKVEFATFLAQVS